MPDLHEPVTAAETTPRVWQSRFGYHPCSVETYAMLRRLRKAYWRAVAQYAAWKRWYGKDPQNRIQRAPAPHDELGHRCGRGEVLGAMPEPTTSAVFTDHCLDNRKVTHYAYVNGKRTDKVEGTGTRAVWVVNDHGLLEALTRSRPVVDPTRVRRIDPVVLCKLEELAARLPA